MMDKDRKQLPVHVVVQNKATFLVLVIVFVKNLNEVRSTIDYSYILKNNHIEWLYL